MRYAAGLLALTLLLPAASHAASVTLKQTAQPAAYKPGGRAVDVLGITPGMDPTTVRGLLTKAYGNAVVSQETLGLDNHGTAVETQSYVTRITAEQGSDEITVLFGTPTTGNGVVEVTRQRSFQDETAAPPMTQAQAELVAHYGKPGFDGPAVGTGEVRLLAWSFKGNTPTPCPHSSCRAQLSEGLDVRSLPAYRRAVKAGNELTVIATLLSGIADPSRATGIVVTMSDAATKMHTLELAVSQMRAASSGKPAETP